MILAEIAICNQHLPAKELMNRIVRNLIVILLAAVSCLVVAAVMFFAELRGAHPLFGTMANSYIPEGAIIAGLLAAGGFYAGSRLLRLRPARIMLAAILLLSAGTVYLMDSVEWGLAMTTPTSIRGARSTTAFVANALVQSPLRMAFAGGSSSSDQAGSGARDRPRRVLRQRLWRARTTMACPALAAACRGC